MKKKSIKLSTQEKKFIFSNVIRIKGHSEQFENIKNYLTVDKKDGKLSTTKLSNIIINIRRAIEDLPSFILESASALALPNLLPKYKIATFILYLIVKLKKLATIKLDELTSIVLVSLWECTDENKNWVYKEDGYEQTLKNLEEVGIKDFSKERFNKILDTLYRLGCISEISDNAVYLEEKFLFEFEKSA